MDQEIKMQSEYEYNLTPCQPSELCYDLDDYDPCESGYDITDRDLAVILRQEKETESKNLVNGSYVALEVESSKPEKGKKEARVGLEELAEEHAVKKRICKKLIKNPFFTNRLDFSSGLPLPPPAPPEQFIPLNEEKDSKTRIICPKRRKKCKSKTDVNAKDGRKRQNEDGRGSEDFGWKSSQDQDVRESQDGELIQGENLKGREEEERSDGGLENSTDFKTGGKEEGIRWGQGGRKRRCKKIDRPPCRKKVSEISLMLQPRHIPALQKDLPSTCPRDIPEVEMQILLGCKDACRVNCRRKKCKKKTKLNT